MASHRNSTYSSGPDFKSPIQAQRWSAPPEPHKPYLPYKRGLKLDIQRHTPVQPFGLQYAKYDGEREEVGESELAKTTVADLCNSYPPMQGITVPDSRRVLEITETLEAKDGHGAQVFVCRVDAEPAEYVAKVYDPLYYGFAHLLWPDLPRDVTYAADGDYSREVAAYEYLDQQSFHCPEVPAYYGSWTFDLPTDDVHKEPRTGEHKRPVRMILIEFIDGKTMLSINVARTPVEHRLDVLTRAMETESRLLHIGLDHGDVTQRNIILCGYDSTSEAPTRVCLFDFNIAVIEDRSQDVVEKGIVPEKTKLPVSPVDLWWHTGIFEFGSWLPEDWQDPSREWRRWMFESYRNSTLFEPPERTPEEDGPTGDQYHDSCDDWVPTYNDAPLSPELEGDRESLEREQRTGDFIHGSPKRSRSDFEGDGVDNEMELRNAKIMAHKADFGIEPDNRVVDSDQPLLGPITIGVDDYDTAKVFYSAFRPLGLRLVYDSEEEGPSFDIRTLRYGPGMFETVLSIVECGDGARAPGRGSHITLNAPSRPAVAEFHTQALANGGTCDGKPCVRATAFEPHDYSAIVISPDGWRFEALCKKPE